MVVIGFATTPREVVELLARRRYALGLTQAETDELSGTCERYVSKLESGMRGLGDMSLSAICGCLGVKLAVVEDEAGLPAAVQRYLAELPPRRQSEPRKHGIAAAPEAAERAA